MHVLKNQPTKSTIRNPRMSLEFLFTLLKATKMNLGCSSKTWQINKEFNMNAVSKRKEGKVTCPLEGHVQKGQAPGVPGTPEPKEPTEGDGKGCRRGMNQGPLGRGRSGCHNVA